MPRGKTSADLSNLSVVIPRHIHRLAKLNSKRVKAPSFAAYVAFILHHGSEILIDLAVVEMAKIEAQLKTGKP